MSISPTTKIIKRIAFLGDATALPHHRHFQDALGVASHLADLGYIIVNGGGPGIMLASTLGAKKAGGRTEIITLDPDHEPDNYEGTDQQNYHLADKIYTTSSYSSRLNKLIDIADAFIVFKGGTGTLSEIGLIWEMAKFEYGHHEPLFFYGKFWRSLIREITAKLNFENIEKRVVKVVTSPESISTTLQKITLSSTKAGN